MSKSKTDSNRNPQGLSRTIPKEVRDKVRRRSKFGCVLCRCGFFEYHHFDPEFIRATTHDPRGICLLCASHHDAVHRGFLSNAQVKTAYEAIQGTAADQVPPPFGPLDFHTGTAELLIGGLRYSPAVRVVLRYQGEELIRVNPGRNGEPGSINATFTDTDGKPALWLDGNVWIGSTDSWDIEVVRNRISVRGGPKRSALTIRTEPPGVVVVENLDMRYGDAHVLITEHAYAVGRYRPQGDLFWVTARVSIPRSNPAGAAIEFMTEEQIALQDRVTEHGSSRLTTASGDFVTSSKGGILWKSGGIAIASLCGELRAYSLATGVQSLDQVRRVIRHSPKQLERFIATGRTF